MSLTESRETSSLSGRLMADLGAQLPACGISLETLLGDPRLNVDTVPRPVHIAWV